MSLTALFDASLSGRADREALEYTDAGGPHTLTFGEVDARAHRMAHELAARGLRAGDRLCVHLANCVEFIDLFLACTRLGVIMVPINVLYRERELTHILADSADVFEGRDGLENIDPPAFFFGVFRHHHRIRSRGQGRTSHDAHRLIGAEGDVKDTSWENFSP